MAQWLQAATATDFYKTGHGPLYPKGTSRKYSNFTPRAAKNFVRSKSCSSYFDQKVINFGIYGSFQELVELWDRTFFHVEKSKAIKQAQRRFDNALGAGVASTDGLAKLWEIGHLPVTVLSIEEARAVDIGIPLWVVYNEEGFEEFYWVVNYLETILSSYNWQQITNATTAFQYRIVMELWANRTCDNKDHIIWQGHDFSFRGMPGPEAAGRSNSGHLLPFRGTDTIPAIDYLEALYGANSDVELVGGSVIATEHAVATANILYRLKQAIKALYADPSFDDSKMTPELIDMLKLECEREYILEIITEKVPTGLVSLVCDSFDFWGVLRNVLPSLRVEIESRKKNALGMAKVVVRPDSGDPVKVISGYRLIEYGSLETMDEHIREYGWSAVDGEAVRVGDKYYELIDNQLGASCATDHIGKEISREEAIGAIEVLWETFGGHTNGKGYRVLHESVGLIYGDSITVERAEQIFERLADKGYASSNVVLGIGSYTYQYNTRDTFGMAMKATACEVQNELIELYKDPKTASSKKSAKGFLRVTIDGDGKYALEQNVDMDWRDLYTGSGELRPLYADGRFVRQEIYSTLCARMELAVIEAVARIEA